MKLSSESQPSGSQRQNIYIFNTIKLHSTECSELFCSKV
jgi:hypothetical protein